MFYDAGVQNSRSRVQGSGFRVQDSGFRVQGSGCRVHVRGLGVASKTRMIFPKIRSGKGSHGASTCARVPMPRLFTSSRQSPNLITRCTPHFWKSHPRLQHPNPEVVNPQTLKVFRSRGTLGLLHGRGPSWFGWQPPNPERQRATTSARAPTARVSASSRQSPNLTTRLTTDL